MLFQKRKFNKLQQQLNRFELHKKQIIDLIITNEIDKIDKNIHKIGQQ